MASWGTLGSATPSSPRPVLQALGAFLACLPHNSSFVVPSLLQPPALVDTKPLATAAPRFRPIRRAVDSGHSARPPGESEASRVVPPMLLSVLPPCWGAVSLTSRASAIRSLPPTISEEKTLQRGVEFVVAMLLPSCFSSELPCPRFSVPGWVWGAKPGTNPNTCTLRKRSSSPRPPWPKTIVFLVGLLRSLGSWKKRRALR